MNSSLIDSIPDEILLNILNYFDFRSLSRVSLVSKKFNVLSNFDNFWKAACNKYWLVDELNSDEDSWKSCFQRIYGDFGRYIECYAEIKSIWNKIAQNTSCRAPRVYESLNFATPLTERQLDEIEQKIGQKLPDDFRCSYRICDGQLSGHQFGLFGGYEIDDPGDFLLSFMNNLRNLLEDFKYLYQKEFSTDSALLPFAGRRNHDGSLRVANHFFQALYLTKASATDSDPPNGSVVSIQSEKSMKTSRFFIYGKTFKQFLTNFSVQLADYPVHNNIILKFSFNSVGDTGPFQVETRTAFLREHSNLEPRSQHFAYRYHITIKMDQKASVVDSCQLETRHWVITDGNGKVERVDGPGVVGQYPIMKPGGQHFWISGTAYSTEYGEMTGHFTMRNLKSGLPVQINCPVYVMKAPENVSRRMK